MTTLYILQRHTSSNVAILLVKISPWIKTKEVFQGGGLFK